MSIQQEKESEQPKEENIEAPSNIFDKKVSPFETKQQPSPFGTQQHSSTSPFGTQQSSITPFGAQQQQISFGTQQQSSISPFGTQQQPPTSPFGSNIFSVAP